MNNKPRIYLAFNGRWCCEGNDCWAVSWRGDDDNLAREQAYKLWAKKVLLEQMRKTSSSTTAESRYSYYGIH